MCELKIKNDLVAIINHYGVAKQLDMCIEECAELIQAISKFKRKESNETVKNLIEEMADVSIMLSQLSIIFDNDELSKIMGEKVKRQLERIKNESKI